MSQRKLTEKTADFHFDSLKKYLRQMRREYFKYPPEERGKKSVFDKNFKNALSQTDELVELFSNSIYSGWLDGENGGIRRFYELFQEFIEKERRVFLYGTSEDYLSLSNSQRINRELNNNGLRREISLRK